MCKRETITVLAPRTNPDTPWDPALGEEARWVLEQAKLDDASRRDVLTGAVKILSLSRNPEAGSGRRTGLVVGHVQSGKTLSFTTVAALANDNGFRIVIVIAGMTRELSGQAYERLTRDLRVRHPFSRWVVFREPRMGDLARIRDVLIQARDEDLPQHERRTLLITLKKNYVHFRNLIALFKGLGDVCHVPTLIVDDEADQASLNTLVRKGKFSSTYRSLNDLRDVLPLHTFLQYTATPQAPILINLFDALSPDFGAVLRPGPDYVGGRDIFFDQSPYLAEIPFSEIPTPEEPLSAPPDSLLRAMRLFFVGVASGQLRRDGRPPNRSMMIHPARDTASHDQFFRWVKTARTAWIETLTLPADDPDRQELLDDFRAAHADVSRTVHDLESFEEIARRLVWAMRDTDVRLVNSTERAKREIHWSQQYSWILVGGQVLDRGFTVEGLTVTYMPRGPGVGHADTLQQRARFFGYKRRYVGYCRVFLDPMVGALYRAYVRHEEDLRARLIKHIESERPMAQFPRVFLLDREFQPTRRSVLDIDYIRPDFSPGGWCVPDHQESTDFAANRGVVSGFVAQYAGEFQPDEGHSRRQRHQRHRVARSIPLSVVYRELLTQLHVDIDDREAWTCALLLIDRYATEQPGARCTIYQMRPDVATFRSVRNGRIVNPFQGAYPVGRPQDYIYKGDRELRATPVTVQLHTMTLRTRNEGNYSIVAEDVKFATIWMSRDVRDDILVQPQGDSIRGSE